MGLFSKSSSSSSTQNVTDIDNPVAGASEDSQALSAFGNISILDAGAVGGAFTFSSGTFEKALQFATESLSASERLISQGQIGQERALEKSISTVAEAVGESQSGGAQRLLLFGAAALIALVFLAKVIR